MEYIYYREYIYYIVFILVYKSVYSDKRLIGLYFRNLNKGLITCKFDDCRMVHWWPFVENHQEYQGTVEQYWFSDN